MVLRAAGVQLFTIQSVRWPDERLPQAATCVNTLYLPPYSYEMVLRHKKVVIEFIDNDQFHPVKTEMQLAQYISQLHEHREAFLH